MKDILSPRLCSESHETLEETLWLSLLSVVASQNPCLPSDTEPRVTQLAKDPELLSAALTHICNFFLW